MAAGGAEFEHRTIVTRFAEGRGTEEIAGASARRLAIGFVPSMPPRFNKLIGVLG
jgi:hypothetical protein